MNRVEHFHARRRTGNSVRSAIFVARHVLFCPKLRRSGICGKDENMSPRRGLGFFWDAGFYKGAAPTGLVRRPPGEILKALGQLEAEIQQGMKELEGMLK
jgi:hypothetical protein